MNARPFKLMIYLFIGSAGVIGILALRSLVNTPPGVKRIVEAGLLGAVDTLATGDGRYYIAGKTSHHLYIGKFGSLRVKEVSTKTLNYVEYDLRSQECEFDDETFVVVDSPDFYAYGKNVPQLYRGSLRGGMAELIHEGTYYHQVLPVSDKRVLFQTIIEDAAGDYKNVLGKVDLITGEESIHQDIIHGDKDSYYTSLGTWAYSKELDKVIFAYAYRGVILVIDQFLQEYRAYPTIDGTAVSNIEPIEIERGRMALASRDNVVNKNCRVNGRRYFIESSIPSSGVSSLGGHSAIDYYDLDSGDYSGSLMIPFHQGKGIIDFEVFDTMVVALYSNLLIVYEVMLPQ